MMSPNPVVVVPTYNERDNVRPIAEAALASLAGTHLLFVDDSSPDGTAEAVRSAAAHHAGRIHLLERPGKQGIGAAYKDGFRWALERGYSHILQMDADGQHDPGDLPRLLHPVAAGEADVSLGSRWVEGGGNTFTLRRKLVSRGGSLYARAILGLSVRDLTGGFKCWRREVLASLDLDAVRSQGYAFQIEMTYRAVRKGYRVVEIPIRFGERASGDSKMSGGILLEALLVMWRLRFKLR
jgi:dolichol-phosphate mannosyltransferase